MGLTISGRVRGSVTVWRHSIKPHNSAMPTSYTHDSPFPSKKSAWFREFTVNSSTDIGLSHCSWPAIFTTTTETNAHLSRLYTSVVDLQECLLPIHYLCLNKCKGRVFEYGKNRKKTSCEICMSAPQLCTEIRKSWVIIRKSRWWLWSYDQTFLLYNQLHC